jgi:hypothetical protein
VSTLDNNGRTPMQLAQSKLKLLQKSSNTGSQEMAKVFLSVINVSRVNTIKSKLSYKDQHCNVWSRKNLTPWWDSNPRSSKEMAKVVSRCLRPVYTRPNLGCTAKFEKLLIWLYNPNSNQFLVAHTTEKSL